MLICQLWSKVLSLKMSITAPDTGAITENEFLESLRKDNDRDEGVHKLLTGDSYLQQLIAPLWSLRHPIRSELVANIWGKAIATGDTMNLLAQASSEKVEKEGLCYPLKLSPKGLRSTARDLGKQLNPNEVQATMHLVQSLTELRKQYFEQINRIRLTNEDEKGEIPGKCSSSFGVLPALGRDAQKLDLCEEELEGMELYWRISDREQMREINRIRRKVTTAGDASKLLALSSDPCARVQEYCGTEKFFRHQTKIAGDDMNRFLGQEDRGTAKARMLELLALRSGYFDRVVQIIQETDNTSQPRTRSLRNQQQKSF